MENLDPEHVLDSINNLAKQCEQAFNEVEGLEIPESYRNQQIS